MQKIISVPKVTILCFTYNQKKYISDALKGFEKQTIFDDCEILIHDDCSNDGTIEIIDKFKSKHGAKIQIFKEKSNRFSKGDYEFFADMFRYAKGEYIAWCEGDDYWTDAHKLEKQTKLLDSNKSLGLCFHPVKIIFDDDRPNEIYPKMPVKDFKVDNLYNMNFIQTNSVVYRRRKYDDLKFNFLPIDWYLHIYHSNNNKIGYIDDVMGVYRINKDGVWYESHNNAEPFWNKQWHNHILLYEALRELATNHIQIHNIYRNEFQLINNLQNLKHREAIMNELVALHPSVIIKYLELLYFEYKKQNNAQAKVEVNYILKKTMAIKRRIYKMIS